MEGLMIKSFQGRGGGTGGVKVTVSREAEGERVIFMGELVPHLFYQN